MSLWKRSDAGEAAIALLSPTSMLEEGSMRSTTSLATAALALALPFILAHCASVPGPLTYDANSVGKPNSGAPMELWLPPGTGPFPAVVVMHGCSGVRDHHRGWAGRLTEWGYAAALLDSFHPRNANSTCYNKMSNPGPLCWLRMRSMPQFTYGRCRPFSPTIWGYRGAPCARARRLY